LHRSAVTGDEIVDVSDVGTDKHLMSEQHDDTGPDVSSLDHAWPIHIEDELILKALNY
jgi:hypothetical protein